MVNPPRRRMTGRRRWTGSHDTQRASRPGSNPVPSAFGRSARQFGGHATGEKGRRVFLVTPGLRHPQCRSVKATQGLECADLGVLRHPSSQLLQRSAEPLGVLVRNVGEPGSEPEVRSVVEHFSFHCDRSLIGQINFEGDHSARLLVVNRVDEAASFIQIKNPHRRPKRANAVPVKWSEYTRVAPAFCSSSVCHWAEFVLTWRASLSAYGKASRCIYQLVVSDLRSAEGAPFPCT
jgi:hypothetical protein